MTHEILKWFSQHLNFPIRLEIFLDFDSLFSPLVLSLFVYPDFFFSQKYSIRFNVMKSLAVIDIGNEF